MPIKYTVVEDVFKMKGEEKTQYLYECLQILKRDIEAAFDELEQRISRLEG